ncbi:MAG: hypothetical protein A2X86_08805 [Bdellovibrionales bacterium GWA2_49_15]|nr:MAG: hypothetical protein A2X86_08805 [Bdellovibrionales bacterium GWA2_49_15]HAZ12876.1 hypothetical protein [Bdellovibrionales bacterium]
MIRFISLVLCLGFAAAASAGTYFDKLSSTEQNQVLSEAKQLAKLQDVAGKPWAQITLSQWSEATPEQVCGLFADFGIHKDYMGDMLKSESHKVSQNTFDVDYVINVPIVSDEAYTVRNVLSSYDSGHSYKIVWNLVRATRTKESTGFFACEPVSGGTFIAYQNFVDPGLSNMIARSLFDKALAKVKATPYAVIKQLKKELSSNPAQLEKQIEVLRSAVGR